MSGFIRNQNKILLKSKSGFISKNLSEKIKKRQMTKFILSLMLIILFFTDCEKIKQGSQPMNNQKITNLIQQMTLEEKIGQMSQVTGDNGQIGEKLRRDIKDGKVGSVINEVETKTINELQRIAVEESRLGIPLLIGRDVIHGFKTVFPIPLGLAATWNPEIVEQSARVAALEATSTGINWTFAPMLDICRDPRWGRIAESFGEDPFLASKLGAAMVKGFQGEDLKSDGSLLACAKHFAGYGAAEGGRDYGTTLIPEEELRNVYLKTFQAAKEAGVGSFMSGFNDLNGVPATGSRFLLQKVLRDEWNYTGFVVSDWNSITEMINHGFAVNEKEAALKAAGAGVDMEMVSTSYRDHLEELLDEGVIDEKKIDAAVYRILKAKFDLGLFENPYVKVDGKNHFGLASYLDAAKEAALQSMVLLKNEENILPLSKKVEKIAVIGPMANQNYEQLGTWIFDGDIDLSVTPLEGLQARMGTQNVIFAEGLPYSRAKNQREFHEAINAAAKSDVVILCVGEESILSGEAHSRASLELPGAQNDLIKAVASAGKPVILVVIAGRPLAIGDITPYADAVLYAFHFGSMGGAALAELLLGDISPSGKLPVTFPKSAGQIPFYYNHKNTGRPTVPGSWVNIDDIPVNAVQTSLGNTSNYLDLGYQPLYPFGYGLSYTTFEYSRLNVETPVVEMGGEISASVTVTNIGNYTADEVVQLYIRDLAGSFTRPVKELKGFQRIRLEPNKSAQIQFKISTHDLSFFNQQMEEVTEPGDFSLWIGGSSETALKSSFSIQ